MAQYSKEYYAELQRNRRAISKEIYKYHAWEKMPGESDKEFRRRFSKRIVIITKDDKKVILGPFGKVISIEEKNTETDNT